MTITEYFFLTDPLEDKRSKNYSERNGFVTCNFPFFCLTLYFILLQLLNMYVMFLHINKVAKKSLSATQTYRKNF